MSCFVRFRVDSFLIGCLGLFGVPCNAGLIAEYDFATGTSSIPDSASAPPNFSLSVKPNGTAFASANLFGQSEIGDRLGRAGRMSEPIEPTPETLNYGFQLDKALLSGRSNWSLLLWFNRHDGDNYDFLFYIGDGDGFGGTGAETYLFGDYGTALRLANWSTNSTVDLDIGGGNAMPMQWHQAGIVRSGNSTKLYLDGMQIGAGDAIFNSFNENSSVICFAASYWMKQANMRERVLDGLIDQIEVYDQALSSAQVLGRYQAFVPEPSALILTIAGLTGWGRWMRRSRGMGHGHVGRH